MEEDSELLDWGNEDDESQAQASYSSHYSQRNSIVHDTEDAVSLGGDDDDLQEFSAYQSGPIQNTEQYSLPKSSRSSLSPLRHQTPPPNRREHSGSPDKYSRRNDSPSLIRSQPLSMAKLTHALPPKPVLASASIARSPPLASTLASSMIQRDRRSNGQSRGKSVSVEASDGLPPDWEVRYPRSGGREAYYYNVRTHESTWTRPQASVRVASPAKDSKDSRARSPSRGADDSVHSQVLPKTAPRKDAKRRASSPAAATNEMTYEDRHYRPGDSSANAHTDRASRPQARPLSPARSQTPPRREINARRDYSRSPSPANDSWRPTARDEDRSWGRSRNEDNRSLSPDTRPRGRRPRADLEPPLVQDEPIRRDHSREWPAHRHRSPLREASPPLSNPRRGMDSWKPSSPVVPSTSKRKNRNDRLSSPNPKVSTRREPDSYVPHDDDNASSENRKGDSYVPADTIPQRRGREQDYMDVEVKRRRTDVEISPPIRRSALPESALPSPSSSLPPHAASSQEIEVPRRKRQPLPPQSTRFKEASKFPPPPVASAQNTPPIRPPGQEGRIPNGPSNMYTDVPSGPRSQNNNKSDTSGRPPTKTSRFDAPTGPASRRTDPNAMDVDYPPPSKPQAQRRNDEGISRSSSSAHLNDSQFDTIPKGPRAMAGKMNAPPSYPPQSSKQEMTRSPANLRGGKLPRGPPPHMAPAREVTPRQDSVLGIQTTAGHRMEDTRDPIPTGPAKRRMGDVRDTAPPPSTEVRAPRRNAGPPTAPSMKLSGTNNIPIGTRRTAPTTPTLESPSLPGERYRSTQVDPPPRVESNTRYADNYNNSVARESSQDDRHYRPAPDRRYQSDVERDAPNSFSRPSPEIQEPPINLRRQRRDSLVGQGDRPNRVTRFGPESQRISPVDPSPVESRMWLTRDESQEMVNRMGRTTPGAPSQSSRGTSAVSWNPPRDDNDYSQRKEVAVPTVRVSDAPDYYRQRDVTPEYDYQPPAKQRYPNHQPLEHRLSSATREFSDRGDYHPPRAKGKEIDNGYADEDLSRGPSPPPSRHEHAAPKGKWDSYAPDPSPGVRVHPERAALLDPQHPLPPRPDGSKRTARGRRQQKSPHTDNDRLDVDHSSPQRPSPRKGASLLDRLQLDAAPGSSTGISNSLRDRVDVSMKEPDHFSGSQRGAGVAVNDEGLETGDLDNRPKGGRGKKRSGKPRRGRRGGMA